MIKEFTARVDIVFAAVCTSLSDEEATERLNAENPTGIGSKWEIDKDTPSSVCQDNPDTHRHIVYNC